MDLLKKAKQCLSIVETATAKDDEINMLIQAAQADLLRQGIEKDVMDDLMVATIMMFVKANFGNTDLKEKELAQSRYSLLCNALGLSSDYKVGD